MIGRLLLALALVAISSPSCAGVTNLTAVQVEGAAVACGYYSLDLLIDFEGNLRGQQLVVALTAGSIYQDPFGSDTAPSGALFASFPAAEFDSFVTIGGFTSDTSESVLVVGGAPNLPGDASQKFDESGINIAWAPGTGINVPEGVAYPVARLTLSDDAEGTILYFGSTSGTDDPLIAAPDGNFPVGTITERATRLDCIPEPSTAMLASLALASVAARRQ